MPFTLSHAAATWPFRKKPFVLPALVLGCFSPDFLYFFFLRPHGGLGHRLAGVFLLDLPDCLVALWLFYAYVRRPLLVYLPSGFRRRLDPDTKRFSFLPFSRLLWIVISILIGIATHLAWDWFTHDSYWPYHHVAFLRERVALPHGESIGVYKLMQHGSTALGIALLVLWVHHWYRTTEPRRSNEADLFTKSQRHIILFGVPFLASAAGIVRAMHGMRFSPNPRWVIFFFGEIGLTWTTMFLLGLLLCGVIFRGPKTVA